LRDGAFVAIPKAIEAFGEDCRRAVLVVSVRAAPSNCAALVIDREVWRRSGALALQRQGDSFEITPTRPPGYDRPWARATVQGSDAPDPTRAPSAAAPARDATPRDEDLDAGD